MKHVKRVFLDYRRLIRDEQIFFVEAALRRNKSEHIHIKQNWFKRKIESHIKDVRKEASVFFDSQPYSDWVVSGSTLNQQIIIYSDSIASSVI